VEWLAWTLEQFDAQMREIQAEHNAEGRGYWSSSQQRAEFQRCIRAVKRAYVVARAMGVPAEELELLGLPT
jgi:hypothetical protein